LLDIAGGAEALRQVLKQNAAANAAAEAAKA
jgi:hypothetical protein